MNHQEILNTIKGLGDLLKSGILTKKEFETQKELLLAKLTTSDAIVTEFQHYNYNEASLIYFKARDCFQKEIVEILNEADKKEKLSQYLASYNTSTLNQALIKGLDDMTNFLCSSFNLQSNTEECIKLKSIFQEQLQAVKHAIYEIENAKEYVKRLDIPDSQWGGVVKGALNANINPKYLFSSGLGATLGSFVLPGIGTVLGAMAGGYFAGKQDDDQDKQALDNLTNHINHFWNLIWQVFPNLLTSFLSLFHRYITFEVPPEQIYQNFEQVSILQTKLANFFQQENPTQFEEMLPIAEEASILIPFDAHIHFWYSIILRNLGKFQDAKEQSEIATNLDPSFSFYWTEYTCCLLQNNEIPLALETTYSILKQFPEEIGVHQIAYDVFNAAGYKDEAAKETDYLLKNNNPADPDLLYYLFNYYAGRGDISKAIEYLEEIHNMLCFSSENLINIYNDSTYDYIVKDSRTRHIFPKQFSDIFCYLDIHRFVDSLYQYKDIPHEKKRNARESFLYLVQNEKILFYQDTTTWGSGKDGFALTDKSIVWKCLWEEPICISYKKIKTISINESYLYFYEDFPIASYSFSSAELAQHVYQFITVAKAFLL